MLKQVWSIIPFGLDRYLVLRGKYNQAVEFYYLNRFMDLGRVEEILSEYVLSTYSAESVTVITKHLTITTEQA